MAASSSTSMAPRSSYVGSAMVASLVRALGDRARGLGLERIAGVRSLEALMDPTTRLPNGVDDALFASAARALGMPSLGVWFGAEVAAEDAFGALGYLARHAATVGDAFARVVRYHRLFTSGEPTEIREGARTVRIVEGASTAPFWSPVMGDAVLATWLSMVRRTTGDAKLRAVTVELAYARPRDVTYLTRFFGDSLRFDAPSFVLELPREVLRRPIIGADAVLGAVLESQAQELLGLGADATSIVRDIYDAFESGRDDLSGIALALRVHPRTLQRRLADLGLDLRELRDAHRRRLAERLLSDPRRNLKEVAAVVGFADTTGLRRAFIRWTGGPLRVRRTRASSRSSRP